MNKLSFPTINTMLFLLMLKIDTEWGILEEKEKKRHPDLIPL